MWREIKNEDGGWESHVSSGKQRESPVVQDPCPLTDQFRGLLPDKSDLNTRVFMFRLYQNFQVTSLNSIFI